MYWTVHKSDGPSLVNNAAVTIGTRIFTFGGHCNGGNYTGLKPIDIHILDTEKLKWWKLELNNQESSCVPFQRYGHTAINLGSNVYLWGGFNGIVACNTLYCFNTETLKWTTPSVYGHKPGPRDGHSACIIQNCMFIYGGFQESSGLLASNLYMLNLHSMEWSIVKTKGRSPSPRDYHTATAIDNKMYIFGGRSLWARTEQIYNNTFCSHIYYLDTSRRKWKCPKVDGTKPIGRRNHSAFVYNGFIYIFGGVNTNKDLYFQDINRFDPVNFTWMKILPKGTPPCARKKQICQLVNDRIFISGGISPISTELVESVFKWILDDLHVLDLKPSLKDMCMVNVWEKMKEMKIDNFNDLHIPLSLKHDMAAFKPLELMKT